MPAAIDAGGGIPGPTLDVHAPGLGEGDGDVEGVGVGADVGVAEGGGVEVPAVTPAICPAVTCVVPSVVPEDATWYVPGGTSTNAYQPFPSAGTERTVTAIPVVTRSTRAPGTVVPRT